MIEAKARLVRAASSLTPTRLTWVTSAAWLMVTPWGVLSSQAPSFRALHVPLAVLIGVSFLVSRDGFSAPLSRRAHAALLATSLLWVLAGALSHYFALSVGGVDFSIFDWMLESTLRGRLAYSPIYDVNHLGTHSTFLLLLLVPVHALWRSPLMLVSFGALVVWAGLLPLRRVVRHFAGEHGGLWLLCVLAYLANAYIGYLVRSGFRIESMMPALSLWFLAGWLERKAWVWGLAAVGLLLTKEDSALFLSAFAVGAALAERRRGRALLGPAVLAIGAFAWLWLYTQRLQPLLAGRAPEYLTFWSQWGKTMPQVVWGLLTHPFDAALRIFSSGVWRFYVPLLLVPWASARAAAAMAPVVVLLGAATSEAMHSFGGYYATPLVAFALFGAIEVYGRQRAATAPSARARWLQLAAQLSLLLFPLFYAGYVRVLRPDPSRLRGAAEVARALPTQRVLIQPQLFPYLGYPAEPAPLFALEWAEEPNTWAVVDTALSTWPLSPEELEQRVTQWRQTRAVTEFEGGLLLVGPRKN